MKINVQTPIKIVILGLFLFACAVSTQTLRAATTPPQASCYTFTRDLTLGSTGEDVANLRTFLVKKGFLNIPAHLQEGYFNVLTQTALADYQWEIGFSRQGGYFGFQTRTFINALCSITTTPSIIQNEIPKAPPSALSNAQEKSITYYVSKSGDDNEAGTIGKPFHTISKGLSALKAGDTLLIREGIYNESIGESSPLASGKDWNLPTTIAAYPGEKVVLRPEGSNLIVLQLAGKQYIIIDGLVIDGGGVPAPSDILKGLPAIKLDLGSNHIRLINDEIKNARGQGVLIAPQTAYRTYDELTNLKIHDNGTSPGFDHGIYIQTSNNKIVNSEIYSNTGYGIHLYGETQDDNVINGNRIHDQSNHSAILISGGKNNIVSNNLIERTLGGIEVNYRGSATEISQNTIHGVRGGAAISINGSENVNTKISGNTITGNSYVGIYIAPGVPKVEITDNILSENKGENFQDESRQAHFNGDLSNTRDITMLATEITKIPLPPPPIPSMNVTSLLGIQEWQLNSPHTITWSAVGVSKVTIGIFKNGLYERTLVNNVPANQGSFDWTVDSLVTPGNTYFFRVSNQENNFSPFDDTDGSFTIPSI